MTESEPAEKQEAEDREAEELLAGMIAADQPNQYLRELIAGKRISKYAS